MRAGSGCGASANASWNAASASACRPSASRARPRPAASEASPWPPIARAWSKSVSAGPYCLSSTRARPRFTRAATKPWVAVQGRRVVVDGVGLHAHAVEHVAPIEIAPGVLRPQADAGPEIPDGLGILAQLHAADPPLHARTSNAAAGGSGPRSARRSPSGIRRRRHAGSTRSPGGNGRGRWPPGSCRPGPGPVWPARYRRAGSSSWRGRARAPWRVPGRGSLPPRRAGRASGPTSADRPGPGGRGPRPGAGAARDGPRRAGGVPPRPGSLQSGCSSQGRPSGRWYRASVCSQTAIP